MSWLLLSITALALWLGGLNQVVGPITSAPDPAEPVPFLWAIQASSTADGPSLLLLGGTLHALPSRVQLVSPRGQVIATTPTGPAPGTSACPAGFGMVRAELPLPADLLSVFESAEWPAGYRVEAQVGGPWRATSLTFAACECRE